MTARDCSQWRGILALQAIGTAPEEDLRGLAEHLDHCDQCRVDAEEARSAVAALSLLESAQIDRLERESKVFGLPGGAVRDQGPPAAGPDPVPVAAEPAGRRAERRRLVAAAAAAVAAAAAILAAVFLGGTSAPATRTVALAGEKGVRASVSLATQSWGTRATLKESGQAGGQVLTVSMRSSSGRWWVAGSYRTSSRSGTLEVQLSCAVRADQITDVWVSNQSGRTVLNGYVD